MASSISPRPGPRVLDGLRRPSPGAVTLYLFIGLAVATGYVFSPLLTAGAAGPQDRAYQSDLRRPFSWHWGDVRWALGRSHIPPGTAGYYQPLTALSLMLDARLAGYSQARVFQFHLTNLGLHVVNASLLFVLLRRFGGSVVWPTLAALIYAMHPVAVETVACASGRMMLLGTFFSLMALIFYQRYIKARRPGWLILVTLCYIAAVLSSSLFVGLPVLLLVLDVWPFRRSSWRPIIEKSPLLLVALLVSVAQGLLHSQAVPARGIDVGPGELMVRTIASFADRLAWPFNLSPVYPLFGGSESLGRHLIRDAFVVSIMVSVLGIALRWSRPLFVAVAGVVVFVAPALMHLPFTENLLGDTYLYPALIAPALALVAWLAAQRDLMKRPAGRLGAVVCTAIVFLLAVESFGHTFIWHSSHDLYGHVVRRFPEWPPGHVRLVEACIEDNELDAALLHAERAVSLAPNDPTTQFYLGTALLLHSDSRCAEALEPLRRALASNTNWIACLQNLGVALARSGKLPEAIEQLQRARDLQPDFVGIRIGLGNAYLQAHQPASARKEFQEALRHRSDPDIHLGLAVAWAANDMPEMARKHLAEAVAADPRVARKAATYPELLRFRNDPTFAPLMDAAGTRGAASMSSRPDLETAHSAQGS